MFSLQRLTIIYIASIILISVIYFQIYYHIWFMKLFGWEKAANQNAFFILAFTGIFIICQLVLLKQGKIEKKINESSKRLVIPILLYVVFGSFVIILHEEGFGAIKRYFFYLFSPMLVCISIFGLYRNNENLKTALQTLFIVGVTLSIYSMILHWGTPNTVNAVHSTTKDGVVSWGVLDETHNVINPVYFTKKGAVVRFAFPGIAPNTFASMLIPIILIGLYFIKNSKGIFEYIYVGVTLFLFYTLLETISRAVFVSVVIGMAYFIVRSWSGFKKMTVIIFIAGLMFVTAIQETFFLRALQTIAAFNPSITEVSFLEKIFEEKIVAIGLAETGPGRGEVVLGGETRLHMMMNTLSYIKAKPILGYGFTRLESLQTKSFDGSIDHNFYLRLTAQAGLLVVIPLAFFLFLLYNNARNVLVRRPSGDMMISGSNSKDMGVLLLAGLFAFLVDLNAPPGFFHFYWVWFGFAAAWARNCEAEYRILRKPL